MHATLHSPTETVRFGELLGQTALPNDILWLSGELGAGKTELTRGVAQGLESSSPVSSPSFALVHEYTGGRLPLYHLDLYRLDATAALDLGLEEYLEVEGVAVVEWGERVPAREFPDGLELTLLPGDAPEIRHLRLRARGPAGEAWCARVRAAGARVLEDES
jgi:tRNA threonylcarbamoyladenosine biosynthesis protein TsaE